MTLKASSPVKEAAAEKEVGVVLMPCGFMMFNRRRLIPFKWVCLTALYCVVVQLDGAYTVP